MKDLKLLLLMIINVLSIGNIFISIELKSITIIIISLLIIALSIILTIKIDNP